MCYQAGQQRATRQQDRGGANESCSGGAISGGMTGPDPSTIDHDPAKQFADGSDALREERIEIHHERPPREQQPSLYFIKFDRRTSLDTSVTDRLWKALT